MALPVFDQHDISQNNDTWHVPPKKPNDLNEDFPPSASTIWAGSKSTRGFCELVIKSMPRTKSRWTEGGSPHGPCLDDRPCVLTGRRCRPFVENLSSSCNAPHFFGNAFALCSIREPVNHPWRGTFFQLHAGRMILSPVIECETWEVFKRASLGVRLVTKVGGTLRYLRLCGFHWKDGRFAGTTVLFPTHFRILIKVPKTPSIAIEMANNRSRQQGEPKLRDNCILWKSHDIVHFLTTQYADFDTKAAIRFGMGKLPSSLNLVLALSTYSRGGAGRKAEVGRNGRRRPSSTMGISKSSSQKWLSLYNASVVLNFNGDVEVSGERAKWANIYCSSSSLILSILIASNIAQSCSKGNKSTKQIHQTNPLNKSTKQTHQHTNHHLDSYQNTTSTRTYSTKSCNHGIYECPSTSLPLSGWAPSSNTGFFPTKEQKVVRKNLPASSTLWPSGEVPSGGAVDSRAGTDARIPGDYYYDLRHIDAGLAIMATIDGPEVHMVRATSRYLRRLLRDPPGGNNTRIKEGIMLDLAAHAGWHQEVLRLELGRTLERTGRAYSRGGSIVEQRKGRAGRVLDERETMVESSVKRLAPLTFGYFPRSVTGQSPKISPQYVIHGQKGVELKVWAKECRGTDPEQKTKEKTRAKSISSSLGRVVDRREDKKETAGRNQQGSGIDVEMANRPRLDYADMLTQATAFEEMFGRLHRMTTATSTRKAERDAEEEEEERNDSRLP
ncbi:hypothetical protein CCUS01_14067 [Colletotrichum cuscutae]|uniref:Uncharacterized protein n=1 Tax=Colletotrichum cuscutae TaxID=1209917 RepID=A0AAJ0DM37_9PEZI|nr:hypothetical protein CCUS01_14067 [Colletotrichum cuscutae]